MRDIFIYNNKEGYCVFPNIDFFDLFRERFPRIFVNPNRSYSIHKVFKKLSILIEEESLYDENNTEIIIFKGRFRTIVGCEAISYYDLKSYLFCNHALSRVRTGRHMKRVRASWHNPETTIFKRTHNPDYDRAYHECNMLVDPILLEVLKAVRPLRETEEGYPMPLIEESVATYLNLNEDKLYRENSSLIYVYSDELLSNLTGVSIVTALQLRRITLSFCYFLNQSRCMSCQRDILPIPYEGPYIDSSDSEPDR